jgi:hypothetical protein
MMACTFRIRPPYEQPTIVTGRAEPGDISLDFNVTPAQEQAVRDALGQITNAKIKPGLKSVYSYSPIGWLLMVIGAGFLYLFYRAAEFLYYHHHDRPFLSLALAAAWTVGVPVYFYLEHEFAFFYGGDPTQYEQFKRVQDLAAKIWAGALAVFGAILTDKWITGG